MCPDQVFVSLPLPARTGLPVSLHGHFCLDSEGRKNFWTSCSNESSDRKLWNQAILSWVLAPAYVDLLEHIIPYVKRKTNDTSIISLEMFWKTFPDKQHAKSKEWAEFGEAVYEAAVKMCAAIIPNADTIGWMAPIGGNEKSTLFTNVPMMPTNMFNLFLRIGMPLPQECPQYVVNQFVKLECSTISPEDVIDVLRTEPERICLQGHHLPTHISNTMFYCKGIQDAHKARSSVDENRNVKNAVNLAKDIFSYIIGLSASDQPKISLSGIPLLITCDLIVRKFGGKIYKPHTDHGCSIADLFPNSQDEFALRFIAECWKVKRIEEEFLIIIGANDIPALLEKSFPGLWQGVPGNYFIQDNYLTENTDTFWLRRFWSAMLDICGAGDEKCEANNIRSKMESIRDWNLIPMRINGRSSGFLFSLAFKDRFLSRDFMFKFSELPNGLPCEQGLLCSSSFGMNNLGQILQGVCVNSPAGLVHLLGFWKDSLKWSQGSARTIRDYLNSKLPELGTREKDIIKRVPIFSTETESLISIDHNEALFRRFESTVPKSGAKFWRCGNVLFVKHDERITQLYKWLGINEMDDLMLVNRFVIPALPNMKPHDQVKHMEFIRYNCSTNPQKWQESLQLLARTPFVLGRRLVSEFFNHEENLFKLMEDDQDFLPLELVTALDGQMDHDWRSFLATLGFVTSVSGEQLLSYAYKISEIELNKMDEIDSKCRAVLLSLRGLQDPRQESEVFDSLCVNIFDIAFVPSGVLDDEYQQLFPVSRSRQLIKINESARFPERTLIWSKRLFLPDWTNELVISYLLQKYSSFKLDFDDVVQHASIVLSRLKPAKDMERTCNGINSEGCIKTLERYLRMLYSKIDSNSDKLTSVMEKLHKIPLILVEHGTRLMVPSMVVRKLDNDIPPFLYALPQDLKPYKKILEQIGTTKRPETRHFASVLESFYLMSQNLDNPNIAKGIQIAQSGLILQSTQDWKHIQRMYLLTKQNTLMLSCDLIFKDEGNLPDDGSTLSYWSHPNCEIKRVIDFVDTMPQHLKPLSYSGIVEKTLDIGQTSACPLEMCSNSLNLELVLKSDQFWMALQRIYYKDKGEVGQLSVWEQGRDILNLLTVKCCERIVIVEKILDQSAVTVSKKMFIVDNTIHIDHAAMDQSTVLITGEIVEYLVKSLPLRNCSKPNLLLMLLLECSPDKILKVLTEEDMPELPGPGITKLSLGSMLPARLIELLIRSPALFFAKGELVGFETHDGPDEFTIILAEIIEVKCSERLKGIYKIKFGEETNCVCDVSALDLFQFRSEANRMFAQLVAVGSPAVVVPGAEEMFANITQFEEAKIEVTKMMEEAWKLPPNERRKAIKRIMLSWHPDKNPDRNDLAAAVFQHIQAQLNRLESGIHAMVSDFNIYYQGWSRAETRAPSNEYCQYTPRRNPSLGKKFFTQAEENLKTAQNMGDDCGNDSVVYMVHQAVELALKGLLISATGNNSHSHCLYSLASEASGLPGMDPALQSYVVELMNKCNTEYIRMRYPNECLDIPHRIYTEIHRENALAYGVKIMDQLRHF